LVRQESLVAWEGQQDAVLKLREGTQWVEIPPGKGWPPAGSESCVVTGQPALRSVDSECAGRVIEPRNDRFARADSFKTLEGRMISPQWLGDIHLAGVGEQGMYTLGFPRNLGGPWCST
jgi:hypothetical protein